MATVRKPFFIHFCFFKCQPEAGVVVDGDSTTVKPGLELQNEF